MKGRSITEKYVLLDSLLFTISIMPEKDGSICYTRDMYQ